MNTTVQAPASNGARPNKILMKMDPCYYIEQSLHKSGTFIEWSRDKVGQAVILTEDRQEILRVPRDPDNEWKPIRNIGAVALRTMQDVSISERFTFLENFVDMTLHGRNNSLIVAGEGGLGKTFTVLDRLKVAGKVEKKMRPDGSRYGEGDFLIIKGHSTPKALYRSLHENREGGLVLYDDSDDLLKDIKAINVLKAALDSYDKRVISWLTDVQKDPDLPMQFEFKGQVIFLTNFKMKAIPQPMISRTLFVDVSMTRDEKFERMRLIAPNIESELTIEQKLALVDFLESLGDSVTDLNMRTFRKLMLILKEFPAPSMWMPRVKYIATAYC